MTLLTPSDLSLLTKILGRLGSDHDDEVAAAGAAAAQFLRERSLTWGDVMAAKVAAPPASCPPSDSFGWQQLADTCLERGTERKLRTPWETEFLGSLRYQAFPPTGKQAPILDRIARKVGAPE